MDSSVHHVTCFPRYVSLTVTRTCGLKCQMCGQWGKAGYLRDRTLEDEQPMTVTEWLGVIDEIARYSGVRVLLRGGEPFQLPGIMDLIERIRANGLSLSIDTNGVHLERFAEELARIGGLHVTVSVDGPEEIHDRVRGVPGTFRRLARGIAAVQAAAKARGTSISLSLNYTISPWALPGLGALPDVARSLGVSVVSVVPYYWIPNAVGKRHDIALKALDTDSRSWRGFAHESSGIDGALLLRQLTAFRENLGEISAYPFMVLSDDEYVDWFTDAVTPVGYQRCRNPWVLLDVQPNGDANFCVDFPDYVLGNVRASSLREIWNGARATRFRERLKQGLLPACGRCGAKYMSGLVEP